MTLDDKPADIAKVSVAEVINGYWKWATRHYGSSELGCLRVVIRLLRQMFGSTPAADFGPKAAVVLTRLTRRLPSGPVVQQDQQVGR